MELTMYFMTILMVSVVSGSSNTDVEHDTQQSSCSTKFSSSSSSESDDANYVIRAFESYAIVPHIIPYAPTEKLSVKFYDNSVVNYGNYIYPFKVGYVPFIYWNYNADSFYTVIYINPDVNGVQTGDFNHAFLSGLRMNIPGDNDLGGDLLAAYSHYLPPVCGRPNRNIFLVYEQKQALNVTLEMKISVLTNTSMFDINEFVKEHDLGDPVAGNFFITYLFFCNE